MTLRPFRPLHADKTAGGRVGGGRFAEENLLDDPNILDAVF
ncbi:hypothetical protein [Salipiger pallidus]|nr:hypothetical protein [Salipiger pallidus]